MRLPPTVTPADFMFARFLLSHLPNVPARAADWVAVLRPGGVLAVEEAEDIHTDEPVFREYLDLARGVVASTGGTLYAGPGLARLADAAGVDQLSSKVARLAVPTPEAARMFRLNLRSLRDEPWVKAHRTDEQLARLDARLNELSHASTSSALTWMLRQVALRRR
jgi:hypothetical protein